MCGEGCNYCDRQEAREARTRSRDGDDGLGDAAGVACLALSAVGAEADPDIQPVLQWVRQGVQPLWEDISGVSVERLTDADNPTCLFLYCTPDMTPTRKRG